MQYLGPVSPLAEHFALLYRLMVGDKTFVEAVGISKLMDTLSGSAPSSADAEAEKKGEEEARKKQLPTTFISDIKSFFKAWMAVIGQSGDPVTIARWTMDRSLWVNRWMEFVPSE